MKQAAYSVMNSASGSTASTLVKDAIACWRASTVMAVTMALISPTVAAWELKKEEDCTLARRKTSATRAAGESIESVMTRVAAPFSWA